MDPEIVRWLARPQARALLADLPPYDEATALTSAALASGTADTDLSPGELSRRNLLRAAGLTGAIARLNPRR